MKAVKRFKNSIAHKRPPHMDGILGRESRIVQSPMSMVTPNKIPSPHKARSLDTDDRNPIEKILASKGVHRDINVDSFNERSPPEKKDSAVSFSKEQLLEKPDSTDPSEHDTNPLSIPTTPKRTLNADHSHHQPHSPSHPAQPSPSQKDPRSGKGHAHNPLDEHLFLAIGPAGSDHPPDPPAVSESPGAVDFNIYETAYQNEVERIREKQGRAATLFLTRRVEGKKEYADDENLIRGEKGGGGNGGEGKEQGGWGKILEMARRKGDEEGDQKKEGVGGEADERMGDV